MRVLLLVFLLAAVAQAVSPPSHLSRFAERMKMRTSSQEQVQAQLYPQVATQVGKAIVAGIPHFNTFMTQQSLAFKEADGAAVRPIQEKDLIAIMGTAANLLGCRDKKGLDLDMLFWGQITTTDHRDVIRVEVDNGQPPKKNYWLAKHPQPQDNTDTDPRTTDDVQTFELNAGAKPKFQGADEFDLWRLQGRVKDPDLTMNKVRERIANAGFPGRLVPFQVDGGKTVYMMPCEEQIRAKYNLVTNSDAKSRYRKKKNDDYSPGRRKMGNDMGDLDCICKHPKCKSMRDDVVAGKYKDIKLICEIDWAGMSTAAHNWPTNTYNAAATNAGDEQKPLWSVPTAPNALKNGLSEQVRAPITAELNKLLQ